MDYLSELSEINKTLKDISKKLDSFMIKDEGTELFSIDIENYSICKNKKIASIIDLSDETEKVIVKSERDESIKVYTIGEDAFYNCREAIEKMEKAHK